jgi:hypothetical protein
MADNIEYQTNDCFVYPPDGTVIAYEDVDGVLYQRIRLRIGDNDVSASFKLPVDLTVIVSQNEEILNELKKINYQLQILTETDLTNEEI